MGGARGPLRAMRRSRGAGGRKGSGPAVLALPVRPGWIGSAVGASLAELPTPTTCAAACTPGPPSSRATTKCSALSLFAAARKFLGSFSEVSRQCTHRRAINRLGGRRTACAAGLHVGMGHCTGASKWDVPVASSTDSASGKSAVSPLLHTASGIGHNLGHVERWGRWLGYMIRAGE